MGMSAIRSTMHSAFLLVSLLLSGSALAVTIDFDHAIEELEFASWDTEQDYPLRIRTQGFEFYAPEGGFIVGGSNNPCPECTTTITEATGKAFSLSSIDLAAYWPNPGDDMVTVTGTYVGGGQISTDLDLINVFTTHNFDSNWSNLSSVMFDTTTLYNVLTMDNVVVSVVPIPAAVWLFGSALAGLGWMRRRSQA